MERSAVYRRALAPIATYVGVVGIVAAAVGYYCKIESTWAFALFWMVTSLVAIGGSFVGVRQQALKEGESFWSPPMRRVAHAMFPALFVGMAVGTVTIMTNAGAHEMDHELCQGLVMVWSLAFGCALHSASFFMPRGVRWFSWFFIAAGVILLISIQFLNVPEVSPHLAMGILFGASHLAYGIYLYFTEPRKNEA